MKKFVISLGIIFVLICVVVLSGCQYAVRDFGGDMTLTLPANTKLEMITWKEDSLWYLTRPMTENDVVETHLFQQSSNFGVFEGTVTIIETKTK